MKSPEPKLPSPRLTYLLAVLLFLSCFALYEPRAAWSPQESDGGEYATAAVTDSIVHEPGYPVYMAILRVLIDTFNPENPYYALSLFSVVCQAGATALLFLILRRLGASEGLSFLASLAWATYGPVFRTATDVEVFAFHNLLLGFAIYIGLNMTSLIGALAFGISIGLAGAHHQTISLWAPFFIFIGFAKFHGPLRWRAFGVAFGGILIGLTSYITLMFSHGGAPVIAFAPPKTWAELLNYILRSGYGTFNLSVSSPGDNISYIWHFIESAVLNLPFAYFGLVAPFVYFFLLRTVSSLAWMLTAVFHWIFLALLVLPNDLISFGEFVSRFYGLVAFGGVVLAGYAVGGQRLSALMEGVFGSLIFLALVISFPNALDYANSSRDRVFEIEAKGILDVIPARGILVTQSDRVGMATAYQSWVRNHRTDVTIVSKGLLKMPSYRAALAERDPLLAGLSGEPDQIVAEIASRGLKSGRNIFTEVGGSVPADFIALPVGMAWQMVPTTQSPDFKEVTKRIFQSCANWPDNISVPGRSRKATRAIVGDIFLWAINAHTPLVSEPEIAQKLSDARDLFIYGDLTLARESCREGYKLMGYSIEQGVPKPMPY